MSENVIYRGVKHGWQIGRKNHGKKHWEKGKQSGGERKDDEGEGCRKKDQSAEVVFRRDQDPGAGREKRRWEDCKE